MLADNILFLKEKYPKVYDTVKSWENSKTEPMVLVETAKNGEQTLKINEENQLYYIHSKYNPLREAEAIIDKLMENEDISNDTHLLFYGIGLGYHIDVFLQRCPNVKFSIIEPSSEIMAIYLDKKVLKKKNYANLVFLQCGNQVNEFFLEMELEKNKNFLICELPAYQKVLKKERVDFFERLQKIIQSKRVSLNTNYAFKRRWVINSVINFSEVLNTSNILMLRKNIFKNRPAILVAAGPSLDLEIENLRKIKEEKLAYIFSVGSAINALIENNIYPDAICTYDPLGTNQKVFEKLLAADITSIPMIFGSSVGFETLQHYPGPKYHMITSQDTVSRYFLKSKDGKEVITVSDAPTIAVVTLELLQKLECKEIILVGQNLAFRNDAFYAKGIDYQTASAAYSKSSLFEIESVTGEKIHTNESLNRFRADFEARISLSNIPIINTTVDGAAIKGTAFKKLEEVIKKFGNNSYDLDIEDISYENNYDLNYLKSNLALLDSSLKKYKEIVHSIKQFIARTDELLINRNLKQSEAMYKKIDNLLGEFEKNEYVKVITLPINRVEHELLAKNLKRIRNQKNGLERMRDLISNVDVFINHLSKDSDIDSKIMSDLNKTILEFEEKTSKELD
jgi:hypothetical protein